MFIIDLIVGTQEKTQQPGCSALQHVCVVSNVVVVQATDGGGEGAGEAGRHKVLPLHADVRAGWVGVAAPTHALPGRARPHPHHHRPGEPQTLDRGVAPAKMTERQPAAAIFLLVLTLLCTHLK